MKELIIFCVFGAIFMVPIEDGTFIKEADQELNNDFTLKESEYRISLPNLNLKIFNEINKELETRIKAVKEWSINDTDYSQCRLLPEIETVLNGDAEKRTIGLKLIPKFRLKLKSSLPQKYQAIVNQIDFWKTISYIPIRVFLLEKNVVKAEQIQRKIIQEKEIHFRQYFEMIRDRIEKTIDKRLGPTLVYTMFPNTTITLESNAQFNIIQDSLKSLVKCFESIKADRKYIPFIKYAKILLNNTKKYKQNDLENIVRKFNLLDDFNIRNRLLLDAKLTKVNDNLYIRLSDWFRNDYDDDQVLDNVSNDDINNELKVSDNFHHFVTKIIEFIDSLKYETIIKNCKTNLTLSPFLSDELEKTLPPLSHVTAVDKISFNNMKNKTKHIKKHCKLIKDLDDCVNDIMDLALSFKDLLLNKIIVIYNEFIQNILRPDLGSIIKKTMLTDLDKLCELQRLTKIQYNLKSAAQLNTAIEMFENGKQCLMLFGQRVVNEFKFEKIIPQDVFNMDLKIDNSTTENCSLDAIKIKKNIDKIIARDQIANEIKRNVVLTLQL